MQLALEITLCVLKSKSLWLTPYTNVASAASHGADTITSGAPPSRWAAAASRLVKKPVDSITTSTPSSPHGSAVGIAHREHLEHVAVDGDAVLVRP